MAACETWTYRNMDANVFKKLQSAALKQGVVIKNQPVGDFRLKVAAFNIDFQYRWDASGKLLQLSVRDKPVILGCATVKLYADKIVRDCGGIPI